MAPVYL